MTMFAPHRRTRLVEARKTMALLTTFGEVDMSQVQVAAQGTSVCV